MALAPKNRQLRSGLSPEFPTTESSFTFLSLRCFFGVRPMQTASCLPLLKCSPLPNCFFSLIDVMGPTPLSFMSFLQTLYCPANCINPLFIDWKPSSRREYKVHIWRRLSGIGIGNWFSASSNISGICALTFFIKSVSYFSNWLWPCSSMANTFVGFIFAAQEATAITMVLLVSVFRPVLHGLTYLGDMGTTLCLKI